METADSIKAPRGVVFRSIGGRALLVPVHLNSGERETIFTLNAVGEFVWRRMDGTRTREALAAELAEAFEVDAASARVDLDTFLAQVDDLAREVAPPTRAKDAPKGAPKDTQ